jgi:hypothetical protein
MVSPEFFIDIILLAALWLWDRHNLSHKWAPEIHPGSKGAQCVRLTTLLLMCQLSWNLGAWTSRNPQRLSRPVQVLLICQLSICRRVEEGNSQHLLYIAVRYVIYIVWGNVKLLSLPCSWVRWSFWMNIQISAWQLHTWISLCAGDVLLSASGVYKLPLLLKMVYINLLLMVYFLGF